MPTRRNYQVRDLAPIAQGSAPAIVFTVLDADDVAINLTGKTVRMVVCTVDEDSDTEATHDDTLTAVFAYETGGSGVTIGGAGNNVVTVQHSAVNTATAGEFRYFLWNITDSIVLVKGKLTIEPAESDV